MSCYMIPKVWGMTYLKLASIQQLDYIEPGYRLFGENHIDHRTVINFKYEYTVGLRITYGTFWNENKPPKPSPIAATHTYQVGFLERFFRWRKFLKPPFEIYTYMFSALKWVISTLVLAPKTTKILSKSGRSKTKNPRFRNPHQTSKFSATTSKNT